MNKPQITVIIPTYNRAKYLKQAVDSVLAQSHKDFELIISDNCSTDDTQKLASSLTKSNPKIKYYRNKTNLGMVGNWNSALSKARGRYVSILMDDDVWEKDFLKETQRELDRNKDLGFVVVYIQYATIDHDDNTVIDKEETIKRYRLYNKSKVVKSERLFENMLRMNPRIGLPSGILFRHEENLLFNNIGLDPGFWLDYCHLYPQYKYLNMPLCVKRTHQGEQFSDAKPSHLYFQRTLYLFNKAYEYLLLSGKLTEQLEGLYFENLASLVKYFPINNLIKRLRRAF